MGYHYWISIRDSWKSFQVFEQYRSDIVYHVAVHKHVPRIENSPCDAIKNNALGTYKKRMRQWYMAVRDLF